MLSIPRFRSLLCIGTGLCCMLLQGYTIENLDSVSKKGDVVSARRMVMEAISPQSLPELDPRDLKEILDADHFEGLPLTQHIISTITPENLNKLRPITIRHLLMKADKPTGEHIVKILTNNPDLLLTINPQLMSLFLVTANNGYAQEIARSITPATLPKINPEIILDLIKANRREVGNILVPLITYENCDVIHPSIKKALSGLNSYVKRIEQVELEKKILSDKDDMEKFMKDLSKVKPSFKSKIRKLTENL